MLGMLQTAMRRLAHSCHLFSSFRNCLKATARVLWPSQLASQRIARGRKLPAPQDSRVQRMEPSLPRFSARGEIRCHS
jgi:hypothetical protein